MDFLVGGMWLGTLAVLVGLALRDGGARWTRVRRPSGSMSREYAAALDRVCRAGGRWLLLGGAALLLVTLLALLTGVDDAVGGAVVVLTAAFVAVGVAWWTLQAHRAHLRPLAAWPAAPRVAHDAPPSLAVAIDRGLAAAGAACATPSEPAERDDASAVASEPSAHDPSLDRAEPAQAVPDGPHPEPDASATTPGPEEADDGDDGAVLVEFASTEDGIGGGDEGLQPAIAAPDLLVDDANATAGDDVVGPLDGDAEPADVHDAEDEPIERLAFAGRDLWQRRLG